MASSSSSSPEISGAPTTSQQSSVQYSDLSRDEVLEDLSSRFILNLPEEELASVERVCFQVEQAHWYYEDFVREQNPHKFPSYTLKTFSEALFRQCPLLHHWAQDHERAFASFMQYKTRVPVCGAIMLDATWEKCVLVKGWKSSAGWGFPKGKINEQEPRPHCAVREVLEETGYDLDGQLVPEDVIELCIKEQTISLYIVPGVPEDYPFKTRTRKEISKIAWFRLSDLPTWKRSKTVPGKFYLISPFIGPLKAFINNRRPRTLGRKSRRTPSGQLTHELHVSSEEDTGPGHLYSMMNIDHNAQESSSQSSSADNGEPQTPSPQYSAPRINHPISEHISPRGVAAAAQESLNLDGVDPHFARLLNALSISAIAVDEPQTSELSSLAQKAHLSVSSSAPLPPISASPIHHPPAPAAQSDWSARVPAERTSLSTTRAGSLSTHSSFRPSTAISAHSHIHTSTSTSNVYPPSTSPRADPNSLLPSPSVARAMPSHSLASSVASAKQSPQTSHGRRVSNATADISPYLSRPRDIPKEMKYISMLESVAKESDRMSSRLEHRPTMLPPSTDLANRNCLAPGSSASVPPLMHGTRMESPVIYSSAPAASSMLTSVSRPALPFDPRPLDDPFTVRPRPSTTFHPVPYSHPTSALRPSLMEDQLRYVMPSADLHGYAPSRPHSTYAQSFQVAPPLGPEHAMRLPLPQVQAAMPALRVIPPSELPAQRYGEPPPLSAPAMSPSFTFRTSTNISRSANNAHLLSILNTPAPTLRAVPNVVGHGVYNGMDPTR
ncbi:pyrophosphatase DCP2 [Amylocystis lapponica]|nr:pyrophosphatase DCP2 [Amylocystis lapponica]